MRLVLKYNHKVRGDRNPEGIPVTLPVEYESKEACLRDLFDTCIKEWLDVSENTTYHQAIFEPHFRFLGQSFNCYECFGESFNPGSISPFIERVRGRIETMTPEHLLIQVYTVDEWFERFLAKEEL